MRDFDQWADILGKTFFVRLMQVSALEHVHFRQVLLYFLLWSFKARHALTAQSNQNIRMKMGVADIRHSHFIVVNIVDESLI